MFLIHNLWVKAICQNTKTQIESKLGHESSLKLKPRIKHTSELLFPSVQIFLKGSIAARSVFTSSTYEELDLQFAIVEVPNDCAGVEELNISMMHMMVLPISFSFHHFHAWMCRGECAMNFTVRCQISWVLPTLLCTTKSL
jgi:hypothetical protein